MPKCHKTFLSKNFLPAFFFVTLTTKETESFEWMKLRIKKLIDQKFFIESGSEHLILQFNTIFTNFEYNIYFLTLCFASHISTFHNIDFAI